MKLHNLKSAASKAAIAVGASMSLALPSFAADPTLSSMVTDAFAGGEAKTAILAAGGILIGLAVVTLGIKKVTRMANGGN